MDLKTLHTQKEKKWTANLITGLRILLSVVLLFFPVFSFPFYMLYLAAGFTDMIDGTIARMTDSVSTFGSKLDTVADFVLVAVCLFKLLPVLTIKRWMMVWIAMIAFVKGINLLVGFVLHHQLTAVHSLSNKITGALLFVLPLTLNRVDLQISGSVLCTIATIAAIDEGYRIVRQKQPSDSKS